MKFGLKLFLAYAGILGLGIYFFLNSMLLEVKPGLRQSLETALIDTSNLLAEVVGPSAINEPIQIQLLKPAIEKTLKRPINATIWSHKQAKTDLRVYVTNRQGIVIYDSSNQDIGADYSQWNDVYLTLRGRYGARSTQENPQDNFSSVMYIGAPIYAPTEKGEQQIAGVISVGKPNVSVEPFWQAARDNIRSKGMWLLIAAALAGALLATWLSLSIHRLVDYAQKVSKGEQSQTPKLSDPDLAQLADAMEQMRTALDGKQYIEEYTLSLTHEMKSPLTTLQGAAELIAVADNKEMQQQLAQNIEAQTERLKALVDKVLSLARLENRAALESPEQVNLTRLIQNECEQISLALKQQRDINIALELDENIQVAGDHLLLAQAIRGLLDNAIDFSPDKTQIEIHLSTLDTGIELIISDHGSGIPEYALDQIWNRFYSLPRPNTGQKSTGLGLSFVQQIAQLHGATISLSNRDKTGVEAKLRFPK